MKAKMILLTAALTLPLTFAIAGPGDGGFGGRHGDRLERLTVQLHLNAEQKTKLGDIFKAEHEKIKAIREASRTQLQTVLTPEQMKKLDELKQSRMEKWQKRHGKPHGEPAPDQ